MDAATAVSLVLGGVGTVTGVAALGQQWVERRRKLRLTYGLTSIGPSFCVRVANPTLVALTVKHVSLELPRGDSTLAAIGMSFEEAIENFRPGGPGLNPAMCGPSEAVVQARDHRIASITWERMYNWFGDRTMRLRPYAEDALGRRYYGRPIDVYVAAHDYTLPRRRVMPPWGWGRSRPLSDTAGGDDELGEFTAQDLAHTGLDTSSLKE